MTVKKRILRTILAVVTLALLLAAPVSVSAIDPATLSINPSTSTVTNGDSVMLTIRVNGGTNNIIGAQACIMYDSTKVTPATPNTSGTALGYKTPSGSSDCSAGELQISQYALPPFPSGTFTLATVGFTAKAGGTTAPLSFDAATSYIKDDTTVDGGGNPANIMTGSSGSILTLNDIPTPATPSGSSNASPAAPTNPAAPKKSDTKVTPVTPPVVPASIDPTTPNNPIMGDTQTQATFSPTTVKRKSSSKPYLVIGSGVILFLALAGILIKFVILPRRIKPSIPASMIAAVPESINVQSAVPATPQLQTQPFSRPPQRPLDL